MNPDYIQSEIDRYTLAVEDDKKKLELIKQNLKYNERGLKNAQNALAELNSRNANTEQEKG